MMCASCYAVVVVQNEMNIVYLINLFTMIKIPSYTILFTELQDFDNDIMKFIVIDFHDCLSAFSHT